MSVHAVSVVLIPLLVNAAQPVEVQQRVVAAPAPAAYRVWPSTPPADEIRFAPRKTRWLIFTVTAAKPGTPNIGLAEIAVFSAG